MRLLRVWTSFAAVALVGCAGGGPEEASSTTTSTIEAPVTTAASDGEPPTAIEVLAVLEEEGLLFDRRRPVDQSDVIGYDEDPPRVTTAVGDSAEPEIRATTYPDGAVATAFIDRVGREHFAGRIVQCGVVEIDVIAFMEKADPDAVAQRLANRITEILADRFGPC